MQALQINEKMNFLSVLLMNHLFQVDFISNHPERRYLENYCYD